MRLLVGSTVLLAGCARTPPAPGSAPPDAPAALQALLRDSDEALLRRNPHLALERGDLRFADRYGDFLSDAYFDAEREAAQADLAALAAIDRAALPPDLQVSHDAFAWTRADDLRLLEGPAFETARLLPVRHHRGFLTAFAQLASGDEVVRFETVADYDHGLARLADYERLIDTAIARMRDGLAAGVTQPKAVVVRVLGQLDGLIASDPTASVFYRPLARFSDLVGEPDRERLRAAYAAAIADRTNPALNRMRTFLKEEYLPAARDAVGLVHVPGGAELYAALARHHTTTELTPDEIHAIGLREVERLEGEIAGVARQVGFEGSLRAFLEHMRANEAFSPASAEALRDGYLSIARRVDARIPELFEATPRTPLEIRPTPALIERGAARGSYEAGTPDGSRPGIFYYNTYDLPSRKTFTMETLYLHEAVPGHHFQVSLAQEATELPNVQRFQAPTVFAEGWGLYAETLGAELGLFEDPYQRFGTLDSQLFRAVRLVVDTGIHAEGWSRDEAIQYMLAHSSRGRTDAESEADRYIARPGQALAYTIGALTLRELRADAEAALGPAFDVRAFHAQVLGSGGLPLPVLEAKVARWVEERRAGG